MANKEYNLEERTAKFAEEILKFAAKIPKNSINNSLITQLVKSGTSIGANYCEANGADSKKDFSHKISICKKETKETKYWLRIIVSANPSLKDEARKLWKEAEEFNLIFSKIVRTCRNKN
ncbi:four helix bundle protein [Patescibacteria group bacterium]|nr:four helix bundle protein [Patescibacteria group bacterium]